MATTAKAIIKEKMAREARSIQQAFSEKLLDLMTSGFGLVAALAWNEFIKELIEKYIQPFFGETSALISKFVYAVLITFLVVLVTYNLSRFSQKKD